MSIKHAILGLLHYRDMYGYQIKNHIEENFAFMWTVNYGQIYTGLKNLTEEGLITLKEVVPSDSGAPHKKLYSVTKNGKNEFKKWMETSPDEKVLFRDPFMMHSSSLTSVSGSMNKILPVEKRTYPGGRIGACTSR